MRCVSEPKFYAVEPASMNSLKNGSHVKFTIRFMLKHNSVNHFTRKPAYRLIILHTQINDTVWILGNKVTYGPSDMFFEHYVNLRRRDINGNSVNHQKMCLYWQPSAVWVQNSPTGHSRIHSLMRIFIARFSNRWWRKTNDNINHHQLSSFQSQVQRTATQWDKIGMFSWTTNHSISNLHLVRAYTTIETNALTK